jgi:predicted metal-dependent hydrolase
MMAASAHTLVWGNTRIAYVLSRSARQKTLSLRVEPNGEVHVVAPTDIEQPRIDAIVRKRASWIVERKRRVSDVPPPVMAREFVSGETFLYLGRQYRLRVVVGADEGVRLVGRWLIATVRRGVTGTERATRVRELLVAWYRAHADVRLVERVAEWSARVGIEPRAVLVREPKQRWGSCDAAGNVRLNWRIIQAPKALVDYVVAHELVHLLHDDHGRAFWAKLGEVMPDYEVRREALRQVGTGLVW